MKKTRDLIKTTGDTKGIFHGKMDTTKDRNSKNLTEADEIKKRLQKYTELYWQPTPVLLLGKSHGLSSLIGYSPWGQKESDSALRAYNSMNFQILK